MTTADASDTATDGVASLSTRGKLRFGAFTLVALAFLALNFVMTPPDLLLAAVTGWVNDLGSHQVHEMVVSALIWLAYAVPMALLLYRPSRRVNTVLLPLLFAIPSTAMAWLAESFLVPGFAIGTALLTLVLLLHPAGRSVLQVDRVAAVNRRVAALFVLGAAPLLLYAAFEVARQLGPVDEHVVFVHYGTMGIAALVVVAMGSLGVVRQRDWRFATWTAGAIALFLGSVSVAYPAGRSSLGLIGGVLLIGWAVAFVASVERVRRGGIESGTETRDEVIAGSG